MNRTVRIIHDSRMDLRLKICQQLQWNYFKYNLNTNHAHDMTSSEDLEDMLMKKEKKERDTFVDEKE